MRASGPVRAALAAAAAAVLFAWAPAAAQGGIPCGLRDQITAKLAGKYGETRRGGGVAAGAPGGALFEIFASAETGTWTILRSTPDGIACVMAVGEGWQDNPPPAPGDNT